MSQIHRHRSGRNRIVDQLQHLKAFLRAVAYLACFASAAAMGSEDATAPDGIVLIASPQGAVGADVFGRLYTSIGMALDHCSSEPSTKSPASDSHAAIAATPIKNLSWADGSRFYPDSLLREGAQATGLARFEVDALGNPRFAHVSKALPADPRSEFHEAIRSMVSSSKFAPATIDGHPVAAWKYVKVNFLQHDEGPFGNLLHKPKLQEVLAKARNGDVTSMAVAQYLNALDHAEVQLTLDENRRFLIQAALAGYREARGELVGWLDRPACRQNPDVQDVYHFMSWRSGSTVALNEAMRLLGVNDPSSYGDILALLHGAANARDPSVRLWAAGLLATAPIAEIRDPALALKTALELQNPESDPDVTEALAAAQAANGQFADAVRSETLALKQAKRRHWNDAQLQLRLAAYQSGKPWTDYLCDCNAAAVRW